MSKENKNILVDLNLFGYYDGSNPKPTYDPGLKCPCIYCRRKLELPVRTISLFLPGDIRSYFYRVHKACAVQMEVNGETSHYEGLLIDYIAAKMEGKDLNAEMINFLSKLNIVGNE